MSLALALLAVPSWANESADRAPSSSPKGEEVRSAGWSEITKTKETHSVYPVSLTVKGNSLCVDSKHEQYLPIYTQGGALYLTMRLASGKNWLYGLPRGRYRINNKVISIS